MTITLRIVAKGDSNFVSFAQSVLDGDDTVARSATSLSFIDDDTGRSIVVGGTGFQYSPTGAPVAGEATSVTLRGPGGDFAKFTGFEIALPNVNAALQGPFVNFTSFLRGAASDDLLFLGNRGNDVLTGSAGDDTLRGGLGGDTLDGGFGGFDVASYSMAAAAVRASLASSAGTAGEAKGDRYVSIEGLVGSKRADALTGDGFNNVLGGANGNDTLRGGDGNDTLDGGRGRDVLDGRAGGDRFVFGAPNEGGDRVSAFDDLDSVEIDASGFGIAGRARADFVAGLAPRAHSTDPTFLYDTNDKQLLFDADGRKADAPVLLFTITGSGAVQESDLLFVA